MSPGLSSKWVIPRRWRRCRRRQEAESCGGEVVSSFKEERARRKKTNEGINIFLRLQRLSVLFAVLKHRRRARCEVLEDEADNGLSPGHDEGESAVEMGNVATLGGSEGFVTVKESVKLIEIKRERRRTLRVLPQPLLQQAATNAVPNALERALRREV
jgi:hypothetical protein